MSGYIEPIGKLANNFSKLPSVGHKTAMRYAYHIINMSEEEAQEFADSIMAVKREVKFCSICGDYTDTDPCYHCENTKSSIICVELPLHTTGSVNHQCFRNLPAT